MAKADKRLMILQAGEKLLANRRFHEVTLSDVARLAGVGKGTIYQYFEDKEDLLFSVISSSFDELCDILDKKVPEQADFDRQLLDACGFIGAFFQRHRPLFRSMQAEDARVASGRARMRERWLEKRVRLVAAMAAIMRKGVEEGKLRSDLSTEVLAEFLLGMLRTRAHKLQLENEPMEFQKVINLFCNGAGAGAKEISAADNQLKSQ